MVSVHTSNISSVFSIMYFRTETSFPRDSGGVEPCQNKCGRIFSSWYMQYGPRAKNKALGLAGQAEIMIGHLYNLIQSWTKFWVAIVENCTENGQWPAAILSSTHQFGGQEKCRCKDEGEVVCVHLALLGGGSDLGQHLQQVCQDDAVGGREEER